MLSLKTNKQGGLNMSITVDKCGAIMGQCFFFGRMLLSKMESMSLAIYPALAVGIPDAIIKVISSINFKFTWKTSVNISGELTW